MRSCPLCSTTAGVAEALDRSGIAASACSRSRAVVSMRPILPASASEAEQGLTFLGLVALEDPPRHGAADAIAACRQAGIRVAMVTGDHPATARAIAREVGLLGADELVVVGRDLPSDDGALGELIDHDGIVIARVAPEDKLRIAQVTAQSRSGRRHDWRRRQRRTGAPRSGHRHRHGAIRNRRGTRSRRPRPARRRFRDHRRGGRAGSRHLLQHPALPHVSPHGQRRRARAVRRLGAVRQPDPACDRCPAGPRARHRHRHPSRAGARCRTAG